MKHPGALAQIQNRLFQVLLALLLAAIPQTAAQAQGESETAFAVYFPSGVSTLLPTAQKTLDSLVYRGVIHPGQRLTITGYADEPGTTALNKSLSQRRAQTVADYLTRDGFLKREDIVAVSGQGYSAAKAGRGHNPRYRRADILVSNVPHSLPRPVADVPPPLPPVPKSAPLARLDTMKANSTLTLDAVLFENASDVVLPSSVRQLNELLSAMKDNPAVHIRLEGHVCCGENQDYGKYISTIRAKAVYEFLLRNGIAASRLSYEGFGFSRPLIYPEMSSEDQKLNRRVEVRIISR